MNRSRLEQFLNPYADDPKSFRRLTITVQAIVLIVILGITPFVDHKSVMLTLAALLAVTLYFSYVGITWLSQILTPLSIVILSTLFMLEGSGAHDIAMIGLAAGIVIASLFLGTRGLIAFAIVAIAIYVGISLAEIFGFYTPPEIVHTLPEEPVIFSLIFIGITLSLNVVINRLRQIATRARENEQAQISTNQELLQLKSSLENRITERTTELEHRAIQMEIIASIAHSVTGVQDPDQLLPSICRIVSEKFGYYHTGIFLIDERSEYAVLMATNSAGGRKMIQRGQRLRVGATGIVGYVAAQGEARIASDVGEDAVFFNNPDLPSTRSEIALPLKTGEQTIGVLDVQSGDVGAFHREDISTLGILADQIAVAIENARLFSQTRQSLVDSQGFYQQFIKQDWGSFTHTMKNTGYTYDGIKTMPIEGTSPSPRLNAMNVPIRIRGLPVGNITLQSSNPLRTWSAGEIQLAEAAAERAGLAIENYRLLSDAQRRAAKERTIGEITSRIGSSRNINSILQTAVEELGRTLSDSKVVLQFRNEAAEKQND
jgi:GAF domain-containing protein